MTELSAVEGGIGDLFDQIPLMSVQIDAVDICGFCIRTTLPDPLDDLTETAVGKTQAGNFFHIPVGVKRRAARKFQLIDETLRVSDAPQPCRQLNEKGASVRVAHSGEIPPRGIDGAAAIDSRKIGKFSQFNERFVNPERHGN